MSIEEDQVPFSLGGPGPEDMANAAAALSAALVRQAREMAQTAAALRAAMAPAADPMAGGPMGDVRRQRTVLHAAAEAASRAALALEAAEVLTSPEDAEVRAQRIAEAARRTGLSPAAVAPLLRTAALEFRSDDAAARIAASTLAQDLAERLDRAAQD